MDSNLSWLRGQTITAVRAETHSWHFSFSGGADLCAECPWRIISNEGIALGSVDHQQRFGITEDVDAAQGARTLLAGHKVLEAEIRSGTCDLIVTFSKEIRLELFNGSSGYEGWKLASPEDRLFIAQGGGQLVLM